MGGTLPQQSLITKSNGDRPLPVRAEVPLVGHPVMDAPQGQQHQPSSLSHPLRYQRYDSYHQQGIPFQFQVQSAALPDNPYNSQGLLNTYT